MLKCKRRQDRRERTGRQGRNVRNICGMIVEILCEKGVEGVVEDRTLAEAKKQTDNKSRKFTRGRKKNVRSINTMMAIPIALPIVRRKIVPAKPLAKSSAGTAFEQQQAKLADSTLRQLP